MNPFSSVCMVCTRVHTRLKAKKISEKEIEDMHRLLESFCPGHPWLELDSEYRRGLIRKWAAIPGEERFQIVNGYCLNGNKGLSEDESRIVIDLIDDIEDLWDNLTRELVRFSAEEERRRMLHIVNPET